MKQNQIIELWQIRELKSISSIRIYGIVTLKKCETTSGIYEYHICDPVSPDDVNLWYNCSVLSDTGLTHVIIHCTDDIAYSVFWGSGPDIPSGTELVKTVTGVNWPAVRKMIEVEMTEYDNP